MRFLDQVIQHNQEFIKKGDHSPAPSKIPGKQLAIFTCMDTRLVGSLEQAMGIKCGDAKIIKNAGNTITGSFDSTVRSLLISIFELGVKEIVVIGHYDCGMSATKADKLINDMIARGISPDALKIVEDDLRAWVDTFKHPVENIETVVKKIRSNPLIPKDVPVHGLIYDPANGRLEVIANGYN